MKFRTLTRLELPLLWSIDRSEWIDAMVRVENGSLVPRVESHDVTGWPPDEVPRDTEILRDCFEHGGWFLGAFDGDRLAGAAVLEARFIGSARDRLQLKFLHVSKRDRGRGLGATLFSRAAAQARSRGARALYISATPSRNTIEFYQRRGCVLASELDAALFELEPEDVHLELLL